MVGSKAALPRPISKLGIGPMSPEIIEAVFRYAQDTKYPIMLIASKNQIDWDGGYVNNWNTEEYKNYIKTLRKKYPNAQIYLCRDHCGPGFKNNDIQDVYRTIESDIDNGFDLIHIDFCYFKGSYEDKLKESKKAILHILDKKANMLLEIGTDENTGEILSDTDMIESQMKYFTAIAPIHFFVCQTGSLIKELNQVGDFNEQFLKKAKKVADNYSLFLKEHNADYLDARAISQRTGVVDAVNIAPQFGTIQTMLTLSKCYTYGIDTDEYLEDSYKSGKWEKWLYKNGPQNKYLCSVIAGHYNFTKDSYKKIYGQINQYEDFGESVIQHIAKTISMYNDNF